MFDYRLGLGTLVCCFALGACATTSDTTSAGATPSETETTQVADAPTEEISTEETVVAQSRLDPDQMICKREKVTGSRLAGRRTCMTRREWEQQAASARRAADELVNRAGGINTEGAN